MAVFTAEMRELARELIRTTTGFEASDCIAGIRGKHATVVE